MVSRSAPEILSPTGVRIPVLIMSIRPFMGIVQALDRPGSRSASFISSMSWSCEMWSGVTRRNTVLSHSGAHDEYQVSRLRHSDLGLRVTTVSIMDSGAGSVEVSARPIFPSTRSTSGKEPMMRSVICNRLLASVMEIPGMVVGIYMSDPSSRGGMNSEPRSRKTGTVARMSTSAPAITHHFRRNAQAATGA